MHVGLRLQDPNPAQPQAQLCNHCSAGTGQQQCAGVMVVNPSGRHLWQSRVVDHNKLTSPSACPMHCPSRPC